MREPPKPNRLSLLPPDKVSGVYFLWRGDWLVYVGQARCIKERVCQHIADAVKTFDGASHLEVPLKRLNDTERSFIKEFLPEYNRCSLSRRWRKERSWGVVHVVPVHTDADVASALGLTEWQFAWLRGQPNGPRKIRLPRKNVRRWDHKLVERWMIGNPELLAQAKEI